jgi:DNA-binding transcriptional MerR regulator
MMTVTQLARSCGLSRGTILYYESIGLLKPAARSAANYRRYGDQDLDRLRQVCLYRNAGLKLEDIQVLLDASPGNDAAAILKRRLSEIDREIETLRAHQLAIVRLLQSKKTLRRMKVMTKEKWVEIMRATGFSEDDMRRWHVQFEQAAPEDHQQFLEFLHIPAAEIASIRDWSRKG